MKRTNKKRLNLYLSKDTIQFAKDWSYVTDKSVSKMLEEYLQNQMEVVQTITPFQWLNDPVVNPGLPPEDDYYRDLREYINNKEEEQFCKENPDHPRAKMRKSLFKEYEFYMHVKLEKQKESEKELIKRWIEVFQKK